MFVRDVGTQKGWWKTEPIVHEVLILGLARVQRLIAKVWRGRREHRDHR